MNGTILYKDVSKKIIQDIVSGHYVVGESLPCHSELCDKYDVSLVTIKSALKAVEKSGYIENCRGRRAKVINDNPDRKKKQKILILDVVKRKNINFKTEREKVKIIPPDCEQWHSQIKKGIIENLPNEYETICATHYFDDIMDDYEHTLIPQFEKVINIVGVYPEIINFLRSKGKKVAALRNDDNINCCCVVSDEVNASSIAVNYLISLGHKNIGFLGSVQKTGDFYLRYKGYQQALIDAGLPINGELVRLSNVLSADLAYQNMNDILYYTDLFRIPTAVFCADDIIAYGALLAIKDSLFRCPEDISIIGVNNYEEICNNSDPPLSSIDKNFYLMGKKFTEIVQRKEWVDDVNSVECNIVIRKSIAKI